MTPTVIRRLNAGMYCVVNSKTFSHCSTEHELIDWVKSQVTQTKNLHCIVWSNNAQNPRATYIDLELQTQVSSELPRGGFWVTGQ